MSATAAPVEIARAIAPLVAREADRAETERGLTPAVVSALRDADLFRLCVPGAMGGAEAPPRELVEAVEALAQADASAAWVLAVTATSGLVAAYMEADAAAEIFGTPGVVVGGAFAPRGRLRASRDDALVLSGRWAWASGCMFCDWLLAGCRLETGEARLALLPREEVEILDTWTVSGLRATGSHDIEVQDAAVPVDRVAAVIGARPRAEGPLYAFPLFGLLALAIAGVALGIGRAALADLHELAGVKQPQGSTRLLAERPATQAGVAAAEAGLRAARALLFDELDRAWEVARGSGEMDVGTRTSLRLAATHATRTARQVVDTAYDLGGGSSVYDTSPLQRRFRDVHAATQHMLVNPASWELSGRMLLGLPTDTSQL